MKMVAFTDWSLKFVLINIYHCNTESQHFLTLTELHKILQNVDNTRNKNNKRGELFNFHLNSKLEVKGEKPTLKKIYIGKMIELIESFELCNIWRIQNPTEKWFTSCQNHISGYMQQRPDCFLSLISYKIHFRFFKLITLLYL